MMRTFRLGVLALGLVACGGDDQDGGTTIVVPAAEGGGGGPGGVLGGMGGRVGTGGESGEVGAGGAGDEVGAAGAGGEAGGAGGDGGGAGGDGDGAGGGVDGAGGQATGGEGGACVPECAGRACGPDGCGGECGPGCGDDVCIEGVCQPGECPAGTFECDGQCVDLLGDINHCGSCDLRCPELPGALTQCIDAECFLGCPGMEGQPVSVDFSDDVFNCGACGNRCPDADGGQPQCSEGVCQSPCGPGEAVCDGACADLQTDHENCGACGNLCPGAEGGNPRCMAGECRSPCDEDEGVCDNVCVDLQREENHCGACGAVCPDDARCSRGRCACLGDGLEVCGDSCVDLVNDVEHCGACGTACADGEGCFEGECRLQYGSLVDVRGRAYPLYLGERVESWGRLAEFEDSVLRLNVTHAADVYIGVGCDDDPSIRVDQVGGRRGLASSDDTYRADGLRLSRCPSLPVLGARPGAMNLVLSGDGEFTVRVRLSTLGGRPHEPGRRVFGDSRIRVPALAAQESIRIPFRTEGRPVPFNISTNNGIYGEPGCPGDLTMRVFNAAGEQVFVSGNWRRQGCVQMDAHRFEAGEYEVELSGYEGEAVDAFTVAFDYYN